MWLPEAAVDLETLDILAAHGMRFTILSPSQAKRVQAPGEQGWRDVSHGRIDPSRPYRCPLPSGREISVFFYDAPIAKAIAFEGALSDGERFIERLMGGFHGERNHAQLLHVATDGETYGHHHRFGEMALAYALRTIAAKQLATLTNYGQYLARFPPDHLVEIYERTSWSCAHGVERWQSDCGCQTGAQPGWQQHWRKPLREAFDWLRDRLVHLFELEGGTLLLDPWAARDDYIGVILDRSRPCVEQFFQRHARRQLSDGDMVQALKLLEMQRHALLMYTSCAWFFADISGIETVQILAYAARAIQLAREVAGLQVEAGFLERLAQAPSNLPHLNKNGSDVYRRLVQPTVATLHTIVAQYAMRALVENEVPPPTLSAYHIHALDAHQETRGQVTLATGRVWVQSQVTWERLQAIYAVLHLGGSDVRCSVKKGGELTDYERLRDELLGLFRTHPLSDVMQALDTSFGRAPFTRKDLFREAC